MVSKDGNYRIVVAELILGCLKKADVNFKYSTLDYDSKEYKLKVSAIAYDELWRQCQAALSVGMLEFTRFESERV